MRTWAIRLIVCLSILSCAEPEMGPKSGPAELYDFSQDGREGLVDENDSLVIPAQYVRIGGRSGDRFAVCGFDGFWGVINDSNRLAAI